MAFGDHREYLVLDTPLPFVVDLSKDQVQININPGGLFKAYNSARNVQVQDNVVIEAVGFVMDYCFTWGEDITQVHIVRRQGGVSYPLGGSDTTFLPIQNHEHPTEWFVQYDEPTVVAGGFNPSATYEFYLQEIIGSVSMVGVPAAFDTTTKHINVFLRVHHNTALQT